MSELVSVVWFRQDLRLADHPALSAAMKRGGAIIPVFIWSPDDEGAWAPGAASRWWLHQSLESLAESLERCGSRLIIRQGNALPELGQLVTEVNANAVYWNRRYEPGIIERDKHIKQHLTAAGVEAQSFNGALLCEPWEIKNQSGKPYRVFTPFWRSCLAFRDPPEPLPSPRKLPAPARWPDSVALPKLGLEPKPDWAEGFHRSWKPGESGAKAGLQRFVTAALTDYSHLRNRPDLAGTSRLSPHLHFGEISPRQVWHGIRKAAESTDDPRAPGDWRNSQFLTEVGWREFSHHLLYHFPQTVTEPLRPEFARFPWRNDPDRLKAWQRGRTGYPIVDAGMRELWTTGWMHNRVRMIVASFLVKDLLIPWQKGAKWFWDTLVDADLAQNTLGWQWTAGCGADAAPFFRIFNPVSQGEKFDPEGAYVRRWVPELGKLPSKWIYQPWNAPAQILADARVKLGMNYPEPILNHAIAREVALEAYGKLKRT